MPSIELREYAVRRLANRTDANSRSALVSILGGREVNLRILAASNLAQSGEAQAVRAFCFVPLQSATPADACFIYELCLQGCYPTIQIAQKSCCILRSMIKAPKLSFRLSDCDKEGANASKLQHNTSRIRARMCDSSHKEL
jgi:hypothetical protein